MNHLQRIAIAFIAGKIISNKDSGAIYDFKSGEFYNYSGEVSKSNVSIYDFARSSHIGGTIDSLYDFDTSYHISLTVTGKEFNGFDFESGYHYSGNCDNGSISFYDFEDSEFYNFTI